MNHLFNKNPYIIVEAPTIEDDPRKLYVVEFTYATGTKHKAWLTPLQFRTLEFGSVIRAKLTAQEQKTLGTLIEDYREEEVDEVRCTH